jgi:group I intron endonuclease
MYIYNAILYHDYSSFSLTILEYIDISNLSKEEARNLILEQEQYYIDILSPGYNINPIARSRLGSKHTEKTKINMKKPKTEEHKINMRKPKTEITRNNMSKAKSGENHPMSKKVFIYYFNIETKETKLCKSFNTCIEAANHFNCSTRNIPRYLDKNKLYKKQWILSSFNL